MLEVTFRFPIESRADIAAFAEDMSKNYGWEIGMRLIGGITMKTTHSHLEVINILLDENFDLDHDFEKISFEKIN